MTNKMPGDLQKRQSRIDLHIELPLGKDMKKWSLQEDNQSDVVSQKPRNEFSKSKD